MTRMSQGRATRQASFRPDSVLRGAVPCGTLIHTLDGTLPIEYLSPGDQIITRNGARSLRRVSVRVDQRDGFPPRARLFALHFDIDEVVLGDGFYLACKPLATRQVRLH
ncbi:hypothetical protein HA397_29470 [Escherichia coli]|nr:hypothetical protein [Escherichia coli]